VDNSFFFSDDGLYLVKSINEAEAHKLMEILPAYRNHLETYPNSLLTKFFGLHRIMISHDCLGGIVCGYKSWWFTVQANICYTSLVMHESYDLKGSTYHRRVSKKDQKFESANMYKDEDFLDRIQQKGTLRLGTDTRNELLWQHGVDTAFLESLGIMDYSILLHIHDTTKAERGNMGFGSTAQALTPRSVFTVATVARSVAAARLRRNSNKEDKDGESFENQESRRHLGEAITSDDGSELYYIGIIDMLETFNLGRATQDFLMKAFKAVAHQNAEHSSVEPKRYRERQMQFFRAAAGFPSMA